jgi:hypothetical protein
MEVVLDSDKMDVVPEVVPAPALVPASDLPWVEKYRPSTLDDLIAHEDIISIRKNLSFSIYICPCLFYVYSMSMSISINIYVSVYVYVYVYMFI